jgi:2-iminobutanoate/2-iminopropanoate deaminase
MLPVACPVTTAEHFSSFAREESTMKKIVIETDQAPLPVGPYTQALAAGPFVFLSGQIPMDARGNLVEGDIVVQTVQVIANIKAVLAAVGLTLKDVVKTTVYLADMADFYEMNRTYAEFFPHHPPARTTIQAAGLAKKVSVEIDAIAVKKEWRS